MGYVGNSPALDETVSSSQIVDLTIATADIAADAITNAKIADGQVDTEHLAALAVETAKIGADAVTNAKIGDGEVDTEHLAASAVETAKIADDAVTDAKLAVPNDGAQVFNDTGADVDFRVEGSGEANALFVQGSDGYVGVGTGTPSYPVHIVDGRTSQQLLVESTVSASYPEVVIKSDTHMWSIATGGSGTASAYAENFYIYDHDGAGQRLVIDSAGHVTMPSQPAFLVTPASEQACISVGSAVTIVFGTEIFDQNADFASNTFTAPVTGKYQMSWGIRIDTIDVAADYYQCRLTTSNRQINNPIIDPGPLGANPEYWSFEGSVLIDMDASDTATMSIYQSAGGAQADVQTASFFSGFLAC